MVSYLIDSFFSTLKYEHFAEDTAGSNFNKNLLLIFTSSPNAPSNQKSFFSITDDNRKDYLNAPDSMPKTGTVIGYREVCVKSEIHCLVKITECYPLAGRQYFNFYNYGSWEGWHVTTPDITI